MGWFSRKAVVSLEQLSSIAGWIGWGTSSGQTVTEQTALTVTAVFAAARVIAEGVAQSPVRVVSERRVAGQVVRTTVENEHWAHRLLAVKPNGWQTSFEFIEGMVFNAVLAGGAIAIKNVVGDEVRELLPVPAGNWTVEQKRDWSLWIRVGYADKSHELFPLSQVFYLRGPSLDGYRALPAVRLAAEAIGLSKALEKQQAKLAGNGGKPSGVLSFAQKLAPDTVEKLKQTWTERFGPNGDGGIAVLDGDAKYASMTMTSVDAQHLETRRFQIEEIARAMRVQPIMLMQADKAATYASAEQMFRVHVTYTLMPWMVRFEQAANRDVLGNDALLRVDFDERSLQRGDFKDQAEYFTKALGAGGQPGWMTQNEVRAEVGLNPSDDPQADRLPMGAMNAAPQNLPREASHAPEMPADPEPQGKAEAKPGFWGPMLAYVGENND
jgi:HK97 family phage portal protein